MEKFILDTCTWIEFFKERNGVKEKVDSKDVDQLFASEVTLAELTYGAINSADYERHIKEPEWLRQYITIYKISDVFEEYGQIRCALNKIGKNKAKKAQKGHCTYQMRLNSPAFCRIIQSVLRHNATRFAAKCNAFCRKMQHTLPQNGASR